MEDEVTQVPDGLPTLAYGGHDKNSGKACVMELVSVLAGEQWSDAPLCTNYNLARYARIINDGVDENQRRDLIDIAPLLISTAAHTPRIDLDLDNKVNDHWNRSLGAWSKQQTSGTYYEKFIRFCQERGVELLRELAQLCDEFNGYDRSAQEPQPVMETLAKIHAGQTV